MIDIETIYKNIISKGILTDLEKVKEEYDKIDISNLRNTISQRFKFSVWDKTSPINGIDAKKIFKIRNYEIDSAYLIYVDDKLTYFQDYNPNKTGYNKMTTDEAESIGKEVINKKIEDILDDIVYNKILNNIQSNK